MTNDPRIKAFNTNVITLKGPEEEPGNWLSVKQSKGIGDMQNRDRVGRQAANVLFGNSAVSSQQYGKYGRILSNDQLWQCYQRVPDVRACVDAIVRRVATWDWKIEPEVGPTESDYERLLNVCGEASKFLSAPNTDGETWQEVWTKAITDLMVFDAGVLENVFSGKWNSDGFFEATDDLQEIVALRGSTIYPIVDQYGHVEGYKQTYTGIDTSDLTTSQSTTKDGGVKRSLFDPDQVVYMRLFSNTQSPLGTPLIESIVNEVITMLRQSEHTMLAMDANEIPPGILVLTGIAGNAAQAAMADLQNMKGKDHRIRVITTPDPKGSGAHWVELRHKAKDVDFVNVISNVRQTIWRVFGVLPVEMGMTADMPRAVGQVQLDVSTSHLINPILELIEAKINARILPLVIKDKNDLSRVKFRFDREAKLSTEEQKEKASYLNTLISQGVMTRNEARAELGMPPVELGDIMTITTGQGTFTLDKIIDASNDLPQGPPTESNPGSSSDVPEVPDAPVMVEADVRIKFTELPEKIQKSLREKAKTHNEEVGDDDRKRTTPSTLGNVYDRGVGAFYNNPSSVRPSVKSPEQWALARVNSFLYALKNLEFKGGKHDTDLLPESHPLHSGSEKSRAELAVGDVDPTNFPKSGDNKKVSLRNSNFPTFDPEYAKNLKEEYPEIWKLGGNIKGNEQFRDLTPVVDRGGVVETSKEEAAVRLREAWAARHYGDHRIAGVVAQIKWYAIGELGEAGMKELINERKKKIDDKSNSHKDMQHSTKNHSHSCCDGVHNDSEHQSGHSVFCSRAKKDMTGDQMLPSEWQSPGKFSEYRTLDLVELHNVVVEYDKLVTPIYDKMMENVIADVAARYRPNNLTDEDAVDLISAISKHIDRLEAEWNMTTERLYEKAGNIGTQTARKYTGQQVGRDSLQFSMMYADKAMSYLTNTGGLLNDLKVQLTMLVSAMTTNSNQNAETRAIYDVPDDVDDSISVGRAAVATATVIDSQKFRIRNWSGKLVDLANKAMSSGLIEANTVVTNEAGEQAIVPTEWYAEWAGVGDARQCSICRTLSSEEPRFRPLNTFNVMPGSDTECGAKCRCVLVLWTKQEVLSNEAVVLTSGRN